MFKKGLNELHHEKEQKKCHGILLRPNNQLILHKNYLLWDKIYNKKVNVIKSKY